MAYNGILQDLFINYLDPALDSDYGQFLMPGHNDLQTWTTGSSTSKGQAPYFQTLFPMILGAFTDPSIGAAVAGIDAASRGDWKSAGISAVGAFGGGLLGSAGSGASEGTQAVDAVNTANTANDANTALQAEQAVQSTSGNSGLLSDTPSLSSQYGMDPSPTVDLSNSTQMTNGAENVASSSVGVGEPQYSTGFDKVSNTATGNQPGAGWEYYTDAQGNSVAISPEGKYYANGSQVTGANGGEMTFGDHFGNFMGDAKRSFAGSSKEIDTGLKATGKVMQMNAQQEAQRQAKMNAMRPQIPQGDVGGSSQQRPVSSMQSVSPYATFNGGYNPRRYGANIRKNGLLG